MWIKSKWLVFTVAFAISVIVALVQLVGSANTQPGPTMPNFDRIKLGMAKNDVESILGGRSSSWHKPRESDVISAKSIECWVGEGGVLVLRIGFDEEDRVVNKEWGLLRAKETTTQKIRRVLGL